MIVQNTPFKLKIIKDGQVELNTLKNPVRHSDGKGDINNDHNVEIRMHLKYMYHYILHI
jgi:hypothetical protein